MPQSSQILRDQTSQRTKTGTKDHIAVLTRRGPHCRFNPPCRVSLYEQKFVLDAQSNKFFTLKSQNLFWTPKATIFLHLSLKICFGHPKQQFFYTTHRTGH